MKIFKLLFFALLLFSITSSCEKRKKQHKATLVVEKATPSLEFLWETDSLLTTCEAVIFDDASQTIYVANVNNAPWSKDNNGFISTLNTKGEITNLKWVEGLSGPKGMGILNGKLYVNDIDNVVEIDMVTGEITHKYQVSGTPHVNDITTSKEAVYISGSNSDAIYKLANNEITQIAQDSLGRLNGLLHQKEGIYYATFATHNFGVYNETNNTFKTLTTDIGLGDGIVRLENNDFIVSSWKGELFYINSEDWSKTQLLDTRAKNSNAADIAYIPTTQTLLVPTFFNNRVVAYKVKFN